MFANLKLRNRMLLGYSVPIILFVGLVAPVFSSASKVGEAFKQTKLSLTAIQEVDRMAIAMAKMARDFRGYLAVKDELFLQDYSNDYKSFQDAQESVAQAIANPQQQARLKDMIEEGSKFNEFATQVINLVKQGKQTEAVNLFKTRKGVAFVKNFEALNQDFKKKEENILGLATRNAENNITFLIQIVLLGAVLGIALSLLAAFLISSGITQTISQAIGAIASSSTEIAATVEQQERTASQQSVAVNETTTTMDQLGVSSSQAAQQSELAAATARQVASLVMRLSKQTVQIGEVTNVVTDLANQTNMLALNAAVEAARAGDSGKGFAIVASEIRKLADKSKKSAEQINNLIAEIQAVTHANNTALGEGVINESIVNGINNIVVSSQQISLSAKQQSLAIQQVVDAMNSLNLSAAQTASGISQTKIGTKKLNEAALNLKAVV